MFEEVMEAAAADGAEDSAASDDISSDSDGSDSDISNDNDPTNIDNTNDQNSNNNDPSNTDNTNDDDDINGDDSNGDRDDLMDYLDSDSSSLEGLGIENSQWKNEINSNDDVKGVTQYLDGEKNQEYRALFDRNGNQITADEAKKLVGQNDFKAVIYNPELNFTKEQLHELADKLIDNKQQKALEKGQQIDAVYAVHMRADGTNGHLHIVYHGEKIALQEAKVSYKDMSKAELKDWIVERSNIVDSVKAISEVEKARNAERLQSLEGIKRETGTEKRDAIIERYMGKGEHNSGNFSMVQVDKSFQHSVNNGKMSADYKEKFMGEIEGRLNSLEKAGIAQKIDSTHWKIDREQWIDFQNQLKEAKQERINEKVKDHVVEKSIRDNKDYTHLVNVENSRYNDIGNVVEDHYKTNDIKDQFEELKTDNNTSSINNAYFNESKTNRVFNDFQINGYSSSSGANGSSSVSSLANNVITTGGGKVLLMISKISKKD